MLYYIMYNYYAPTREVVRSEILDFNLGLQNALNLAAPILRNLYNYICPCMHYWLKPVISTYHSLA